MIISASEDLFSKFNLIRDWSKNLYKTVGVDGEFWSDNYKFFSYHYNLSNEDLKRIVFHAAVYGGSPPTSYWYPQKLISNRDANPALASSEVQRYLKLIENLPESWLLSEAPLENFKYQHGFHLNGKIINADVSRYQKISTAIFKSGLYDRIASTGRKILCEIGAGYGLMPYNMMNKGHFDSAVIVDLPNTAFMSACYCALNLPDCDIYLVTDEDTEDSVKQAVEKYPLVFVPNVYVEKLKTTPISLFLNVLSMQEMPQKTVIEYMKFISSFKDAVFISDNWDKQDYNEELTMPIEKICGMFFDTIPRLGFYDEKPLNKVYGKPYGPTKMFLCTPKGGDNSFLNGEIMIADGQVCLKLSA